MFNLNLKNNKKKIMNRFYNLSDTLYTDNITNDINNITNELIDEFYEFIGYKYNIIIRIIRILLFYLNVL